MKLISVLLLLCLYSIYGWSQSIDDTIRDRQSNELSPGNENFSGHFTNKKPQYQGQKKNGQLHDSWISWYGNGVKLDAGTFQKGIPDGTWQGWFQNGHQKFLRTYSSDKWKQFQLEVDRYHPKRILLPITHLYFRDKKEAKKYTTAINTFCDPATCTRRKNEDFSQTINSNSSEDHYHPLFENGLLHGPFANYFVDGTLKDSGNYHNGLPEGLWIKWTDDRQFYWKGYYQHGRKNKEWKLFTSNRRLVRIVLYRDGEYVWRKEIKEAANVKDED